jgi:hypothetical protein
MARKLLMVLTPVLATVALAIAPTAAQAVQPTWYRNGAQIAEEVATPTVTWGNLVVKGASEIACKADIGGTVVNRQVLGGELRGASTINDFSTFLCTSTNITCPAGAYLGVQAHNLPWNTQLVEVGGKIRASVTTLKITVGCAIEPEDNVQGTNFVIGLGAGQFQRPLAPFGPLKGTGALNPGKYQYDAGSGELEAEGSRGTAKVMIEGELRTLGYEEQELIQLK